MKHAKRGTENSYWNWVLSRQSFKNDNGRDIWEPVEANPDQASEPLFKQKSEDDLEEEVLKSSLVNFINKHATRREKDVIKLLQRGYDQTRIAKKLDVAISTINNIVFQIRNKMQFLIDKKPKLGVVIQDRKIL